MLLRLLTMPVMHADDHGDSDDGDSESFPSHF
jgi:hypothetical protein